ncbi:MAG: tetratricopeptide repeat protein [Nitrosomonadales bacterium]|nr:tetratricopeptide repeat protein [Nitrosomonadales bacterium]
MKPGRNDPCSCGSGKKFKHCCEGKAVTTGPAPADFSPLVALYNTRRYAELESRARALAARYPGSGFAWKLLGAALQMQGKDALAAFQKTAALMPGDAEAHFNLGVVQKGRGLLNEAAASYRRALQLNPNYAEAHGNLGNVLKDLGQFDEAAASYLRALKIRPDSADTHNNLGTALKDLGRYDDALASYRRAIAIDPNFADACYNLGNVLKDIGQLEEASDYYRKAVTIRPDLYDAHINLGNVLKGLGRFDPAVACYRRALEINPDSAEAHNNLGSVLKELNQLDAAMACYRRALEIKPDFPEAHGNIGSVLTDLGDIDGAIESYRRALALKPGYFDAQSSLLFILNYTARLTPEFRLDEARRYGRMADSRVTARYSNWRCATRPERLRIGMVSGDLRNHPVGYFLESLLAQLDPARVELIAYPTRPASDALTARIKPCFAAWKPLTGKSDAEAARLIHADGVHVLLDLSGHTALNRLPVFAWKPAPVQAAWLGYFATTGVAGMDYLIADRVGVPDDQRAYFTETLWYLPDTRLCFSPPEIDLPVAPLPAISNGHVTFGCFQNLAKVEDEVLAIWANILTAMPGSRLRWQCKQLGDPAVAGQMLQRLRHLGIDPARVTLLGGVPRAAYLAAHAEVDLMLDTFPYPGGTTTCEALWMGVPTLTLAGDTLLSRQGASLLTAAGLEDWIATSGADYVARALALAGDLPRLSALRAGLRAQVRTSPLFDERRFAHNLEDALWGMWRARTEAAG